MGNQIIYSPTPITDVISSEIGKHSDFVYAVASVQGWRKKQEDAYKVIVNFHEGYSYFAVFDGHGGSEISEFLKTQLHNYIKGFLIELDDVELALHSGFLSCDASLKDPEVKAVLNAMVEAENDLAARIMKTQFIHQEEISGAPGPSYENLKKKLVALKQELHGLEENYGDGLGMAAGYRYDSSSDGLSDDESDDNLHDVSNLGEDGPSGALDVPIDDDDELHDDELHGDVAGPSQGVPVSRPGIANSSSIQYLLNEGLESTDSEDDDFDVEGERSLSESSDEEMRIDPEAILTQEPADLSGSTATVALLSKSKLYVANVGDSKCVVSRKGLAVDMSLDHTPENQEELQRIKNAGGHVSEDGRVNNLINLSRAFGDFKLKGPTNIPAEQCISAEPFVKCIDIRSDDDFIVIASDGLWNSFTSQSLIDYLSIRIKAEDSSLTEICQELFNFIIPSKLSSDGTGCDNITLLIIKLHATETNYFNDDSESVDMLISGESETDCEDASTNLGSVSNLEQPSSSTKAGSTSNVEKHILSEVDSTSNEVDSTSTEKHSASLASVIDSEDA